MLVPQANYVAHFSYLSLSEICMGQFYLIVHNWVHIHVIFLRYTPVHTFIFMLLFLQFQNCTSFESHSFLFLFCPICMVIFIFSPNLFLCHKRFYVYLSCAVKHVCVYCYSTGFAGWVFVRFCCFSRRVIKYSGLSYLVKLWTSWICLFFF